MAGNFGATAFAEMVKVNGILRELHLYDNHIGDEGAMALEEALKHNGKLESIDLDGNDITEQATTISLMPPLRLAHVSSLGLLRLR